MPKTKQMTKVRPKTITKKIIKQDRQRQQKKKHYTKEHIKLTLHPSGQEHERTGKTSVRQ